ncbi:RIO1 family regulatory kinase/ATPase [Escherichia albertii]
MLPVSSSASNNLNHPIHKSNTRQGVLQAEGEKARTIVNVDVAPKANKRPRLLLNLSATSREISIGSGLEGDVFKDKNNPGFVIKRYHTSDDAGEECELFNRFYGEGSAEVFVENGKTHLRMLEVPGTPLKKLSEFPKDSEKLFLNMIIDMAEHKIIHGDLHMENILYDESAHRFWPIDFSNSYDRYYSLDGDEKSFANELSESDFSSVLTALRNRVG